MKYHRLSAILAAIGFVGMSYGADTGNTGKTMYIHHSGGVDPILFAEIDSIRFSSVGLDGEQLVTHSVQEVCTADSVYRYDINTIKEVSFMVPETAPGEYSIDLSGGLQPYVTGLDEEYPNILKLAPDTPTELIPTKGSYLYQLNPSEKLPDGFLGKVEFVDGVNIYTADAPLNAVFDQIAWERDVTIELTEPKQSTSRAGGIVDWLVAENNYPDYLSGAIIMTDELRDIPAGPAQAQIKSQIRIQPLVHYQVGSYVLPGSRKTQERIHARVTANVEGTVSGRYNVEQESTVGKGAKLTQMRSLGLGKKYILTFNGIMKIRGKMGLDYSFAARYNSSATTTVTILGDTEALVEANTTHKVLKEPAHRLDASMDGNLTLIGSLSLTSVNLRDSLKSVTNTFSYGSSLRGSALFLSSDLDKAATDNGLYQRITETGITAQPVENISTSIKYAMYNFTPKHKITLSPKKVFYALPRFSNATCSGTSVSFDINGDAMEGRSSTLGFAVSDREGKFTHTTTQAVWEGASALTGDPVFDISKDERVYPTATLEGKRILCAPSYPSQSQQLFHVISVLENNNIRCTSGMPIIGSGIKGTTIVTVGNIFPTCQAE